MTSFLSIPPSPPTPLRERKTKFREIAKYQVSSKENKCHFFKINGFLSNSTGNFGKNKQPKYSYNSNLDTIYATLIKVKFTGYPSPICTLYVKRKKRRAKVFVFYSM